MRFRSREERRGRHEELGDLNNESRHALDLVIALRLFLHGHHNSESVAYASHGISCPRCVLVPVLDGRARTVFWAIAPPRLPAGRKQAVLDESRTAS